MSSFQTLESIYPTTQHHAIEGMNLRVSLN